MIKRVRGTDDILDLTLYNHLLAMFKKQLFLSNFTEIDTPILEYTDLFIRAVGLDTDIVAKEMYIFKTAGGESICLRPEGTASIVRAYIENRVEISPWKVFIHGPMFRHERPQKGRWRQFNQLSIEIINTKSVEHDAALLAHLNYMFSTIFNLENYLLKLNFLGCVDDRKNHKIALLKFLETIKDEICETCKIRTIKNTLRIFDCKNETCKKLYENASKIIDHLCVECSNEWKLLQSLLVQLEVGFVIDHKLVRGLDYYYNTVFEFESQDLGAQNSFCGGGRYRLGHEMGSKEHLPSFGVGVGMGRLLLLLEAKKELFNSEKKKKLHVLLPITPEQRSLVLVLVKRLQENNFCTDAVFGTLSISNMMKKAHNMGAQFVLILGPDEQSQNTVSVKNMLTGNSEIILQTELIQYLQKSNINE